MDEASSRWTDHQVETIIGNLLRIGVMVAASIIIAGAIVYLVRHGGEYPSYHIFRGEPAEYKTFLGIWGQTLTGHGRGLIQLGLLLLIMTPIARVAFSLVAFIRQRDRLYVVVTLIVLGVLLYSLLGKAG